MKILSNLLSLFYPKMCAACGNALQQNESCLCLECLLHLPETENYKEHNNTLRSLFDGRTRVEEVASLMSYKKESNVQKILHNFKYNGQKEIGKYLGEYFGKQLITEERFRKIDFIIPIPLHKKKLRKRGFNQSEWIAQGLSISMNIPSRTDILFREDFTETQTKKNRYARWMNVKEVFTLKDFKSIKNRHIAICDDVLTTGATMEAAIQKLQQVNDIKISVITLAAVIY